MQSIPQKFLYNDKLINYDLNRDENDTIFSDIRKNYEDSIKKLYKLNDEEIKAMLTEFYKPIQNEEDPKFKMHLGNLLYLKQSYYVEQKEKEISINENSINIDLLKDIRLSEVFDVSQFNEFNEQAIELSIEKIRKVIKEKNEQIDKWKDYNAEATIAKKWDIPEENIKFISNLEEYIKFISEMKNGNNFVSRGQKDCTYKLSPSLHRRYLRDHGIHASYYESAFRQKIVYYDKDLKNKSKAELRAEGQHFGLLTDFLDFTEAHLISLLFAIEEYDYTEQHSIVYFVDSYNYNKDNVNTSEKLIDYSDESTVNSMIKYSSRSFFIKLGNLNERIHFQKGCFLKVAPEEKLEEKLKKYCKIVIINKECKKDILKELFNFGITFENIYPDKDNVVKSIRFHYEEMIGGELNE
ncbi:FRG domain-containing protein [Clostridium ihumii]|uniref:FRG domain-containing protein n=1 Tax=Clostridium ihumii TaxID=1470356 RepID=UPI003D326EC8